MLTVNIHEAKTHLSRLVEQAAAGESFIIAKAGKPMVKVVALDTPDTQSRRRLGFIPVDHRPRRLRPPGRNRNRCTVRG